LPTRVKSVPPGHLLDPALAIFERLDVGRQVARTEASLRNLGVRRGRRGVTAPDLAGSLTPNERNVVGLVAEGLSKPQIGERLYVSRQTVQTHLVHVFAKLDISSRAQIAGEAARREERTP
jgi:DNA-binding CsgD family transcriptional regulator